MIYVFIIIYVRRFGNSNKQYMLKSTNQKVNKYEVVSKIFRTGAATYTAVVVARSTGPNRSYCEFRVLLRRFAATACKRAKTSPRTLARTDLAASPWQRPVSHFRPHPAVSGEIQKHINTLCVQSVELLNVKLVGCLIYIWIKLLGFGYRN
jgi:hypothetical protein